MAYNSNSQSNTAIAAQIGRAVTDLLARTGAEEVDIVSHSMGSLNSRYCVKFDACAGKVDQWVSLAGANRGTTTAWLCSIFPACREMVPGSALLAELNAGAPLPAGTTGTVIWTREDRIIQPAANSVLTGLENVEVSGVTHLSILRDGAVIDRVLGVLAR